MAVQTQRLIPRRTLAYPSISLPMRLLIVALAALIGFLASGFYFSGVGPLLPRGTGQNLVAAPLECGDGVCDCGDSICSPQADESNSTCPADCTTIPDCGDGVCEPGENGAEGDNNYCPSDCGVDTCNENGRCGAWEDASCIDCTGWTVYCGNGTCDANENPSTCSTDCSVDTTGCEGGVPDGTCSPTETSSTCPDDCTFCNANNTCESWETDACSDCWDNSLCSGDEPDGVCSGEKASSCYDDCHCGDGTCDLRQDFNEQVTCPTDCGINEPSCGDTVCEGDEAQTCPQDCTTKGPVCGNNGCEAGETASSCAADCAPSRTDYCGDGVCRDPEDFGWCPTDCKVPPVCGDKSCNGDETSDTCVADCPLPPTVCGDNVCESERGETATTCSKDCVKRVTTPTTPTPEPTEEATDEPRDEPTEVVPDQVAEVTTSEPPTVEPLQGAAGTAGTPQDANADLTIKEKEFVEDFEATLIASCRLIRLEDADADVEGRLEGFSAELLLFADRVLVCDSQPQSICVPAAEDINEVDEVQIVSCGEVGNCKVYQATDLKVINDEKVACITKKLGRPMPTCKDACATGIGIRVTEADVSGYVIPFGILMTIVSIGGVWFTFIFSRTRNRDANEEIEGMDDEGIVTKS